MTNFGRLLQILTEGGVRFILVGGVAATVHGATRLTLDLDVVYSREPENLAKLASALAPCEPYLRGAPPGLPFRWDAETLQRGLNFTMTTTLGDIDLLGEIAGNGTYEELLPDSSPVRIFGIDCQCLDLKRLIEVKRAAGRAKDWEAIAELEAILGEDVPSGSS